MKVLYSKFLFLMFIFISFAPEIHAQNPITIDIESGMNQSREIVLSDFADDIEYIPLETYEYNIIGNIEGLQIIDSFLFVQNQNPSSLLLFDEYGHYIRKIGANGRGPNEFNYISDFTFNPNSQQVILLTGAPYKIMNYDINGALLNQINYKETDCFDKIENLYGDKYLIMCSNPFGFTPYTYKIFSKKNELIKKTKIPKQFEHNGNVFGMGKNFCFYKFENNYFVKANVFNDTLYCISPTLEFLPKYIFDPGKYKQSLDFRQNFMNYLRKNAVKFIVLNYVFESKNAVVYSYMYDMKVHSGYYDKTKNNTNSIKGEKILNDLDNGIDFFPNYQLNNKWVCTVNALDLILHVKSQSFKNSTPKYPEKKKELEKLANSLDENDNPILMLVKLKN